MLGEQGKMEEEEKRRDGMGQRRRGRQNKRGYAKIWVTVGRERGETWERVERKHVNIPREKRRVSRKVML